MFHNYSDLTHFIPLQELSDIRVLEKRRVSYDSLEIPVERDNAKISHSSFEHGR